MSNIRVLVIEPKQKPQIAFIENSLESFQKIVGGYIECINCGIATFVMNEEGKLLGLPVNKLLYANGRVYDYIAGTFLIVGTKGEDFTSISENALEYYRELFS